MVNQVFLDGNIGQLTFGNLNDGKKWCRFSIAQNESYTDKNGNRQQNTTLFSITAWERNAEYCEKWLRKGAMIGIIGRIKINKYTDKDGVEREQFNIIVEKFMQHVWPDKNEQVQEQYPAQQPQQQHQNQYSAQQMPDDDLPF